MKKKLLLSLVLSFVFVFAFSAVAMAADAEKSSLKDIFSEEELSDMNIKVIDPSDVPDGIVPFKPETIEEARQFLLNGCLDENTEIASEELGISPRAIDSVINKSFRGPKLQASLTTNYFFQYSTNSKGKIFTRITDVRSNITSPGGRWIQDSYDLSFTDGFRCTSGTISGVAQLYVDWGSEIILQEISDSVPVYYYSTEIR